MNKNFIRIWNPEVFFVRNNQVYDRCHSDVFTEEHGYTEEDIKQIQQLEIGDVWSNGNYGTDHIVIRVK